MKNEKMSLSTSDRIGFIISLATMIAAGITIVDALDSLMEDTKGQQRKIIQTIKDDVIQGKRLYVAFSRFPLIFDKVTINIVKAAEEAGTLETTLNDIKENMQKEAELIDKIKGSLVYPIFIVLVLIGVLTMMLFFVIPKIAIVFTRLKVTLPLPTKIMIFVSDIATKSTIPFIIGIVVTIIFLIILYKTQKRKLIQIIASLPIISQLVKKMDLVRFTRNLSMLLNSGIMIVSALEICEEVVINKNVSHMIRDSKNSVLAGKRLAQGLRTEKKIMPTIIIRIIESGEKSGQLTKALTESSNYLDYEVSKALKTFVTLLEPIMLVFVGIMVGGMMISIIGPIYGMIGQVGAR